MTVKELKNQLKGRYTDICYITINKPALGYSNNSKDFEEEEVDKWELGKWENYYPHCCRGQMITDEEWVKKVRYLTIWIKGE